MGQIIPIEIATKSMSKAKSLSVFIKKYITQQLPKIIICELKLLIYNQKFLIIDANAFVFLMFFIICLNKKY